HPHDPRLLGDQPGKLELGRFGFLLSWKFAKQIHQTLIRFSVLWREARHDVPEIAFVKLRIFFDLAREEAFAQRTERDESYSEFLQRWDHLCFRLSPPQRVFALEFSDERDFMRATYNLH